MNDREALIQMFSCAVIEYTLGFNSLTIEAGYPGFFTVFKFEQGKLVSIEAFE